MTMREHKIVRSSYSNLDFAKFICALLVIIIHTDPLGNISELADFYLNNVIARVAVPVFFAISGFLFCRGLTFENGRIARTAENRSRLIRTTKKNSLLYAAWSLAYLVIVLPEWYQTGWWGISAVKDWLHSFLLIGGYFHLWFLLALILAIPALYLLLSLVPLSRVWLIAGALWILECLTYSYAWIGVERIPLVAFIGSKMPVVFDSMLRALPLLSIGAVLSQKHSRSAGVPAVLGAFLLCAAEASALYFFSPNEAYYSYLFATPLLAYTALDMLVFGKQIAISKKWQFRLRDMCLLIYCLHPMICHVCQQWNIPAGIPYWLTVTVLSVGIAYLWSELKSHLSKLKKLYDQ